MLSNYLGDNIMISCQTTLSLVLISTLKRLKKDPPLLKEYDRIINE